MKTTVVINCFFLPDATLNLVVVQLHLNFHDIYSFFFWKIRILIEISYFDFFQYVSQEMTYYI